MNEQKTKTLTLKVNHNLVRIKQRSDMFCATLDTILLTNFVLLKNSFHSIVDFGTNNGIIAILLAKKFPVTVTGIEIQFGAVKLAQENVKINNLQSQVTIVHDDIKSYAETYYLKQNHKVDAIVCNPPFFPLSQTTKIKGIPSKAAARHEIYIDIDTIISSASKLLKSKGRLFMIYNAERIDYLCSILNKYHFAVKRLQMVYPKINKPANVFLIEASLTTNYGVIIEPPIICHNQDNSYNSEIAKWYNNSSLIVEEDSNAC